MDLIETSLAIALEAYAGQKDKAGKSYILHPLRLMSKASTESEMAVALLHDVIEDSDITANELLSRGIPSEVVDAVVCLTKQTGEEYEHFIDRVLTNSLATRVKQLDIEDNINVLRLASLSDKDLERVAKYHAAWQKLNQS
ncbi:GTP pyrophosphokinase [Litoribacillus peritrichatus]|uniref:HD domain-containing protein n=1 Tax=Litoribacillus peritrichatus TaxID=718191 RepID=A0ABP7M829_9GAMM